MRAQRVCARARIRVRPGAPSTPDGKTPAPSWFQAAGRLPGQARQHPQAVHVRVLALARAHPEGRVALQQLDAVEALLRGVFQILQLQVLVEVTKFLPRGCETIGQAWLGHCVSRSTASAPHGRTGAARSGQARPPAVGEPALEARTPIDPPAGEYPLRSRSGTNCASSSS